MTLASERAEKPNSGSSTPIANSGIDDEHALGILTAYQFFRFDPLLTMQKRIVWALHDFPQ
jgi:hypothetical protein